MSATVRQALADAASSVADIECQPYFVQSTEAGAGMVRLDRIEYPNPFGGVCFWNVVVMLPQDQEAAEKYLDEKVPLLWAAVGEQLVITSATPERLEIQGVGVLPALFINGHREQE